MRRDAMLTAEDIMTRRPVSVRADAAITDAIRLLLRRDISGVPVVDAAGELIGILSERDCLRVLAVGEYDSTDHGELRSVREFMTPPDHTVTPDVGIYTLADFFLTHHERRLPVISGGRLVGIVTRRDVLRGIRRMIRRRGIGALRGRRGPSLYPSATDASGETLANRLE